jgi:poly-beta-1,6-N-acetyl-D-glucosamine synthase
MQELFLIIFYISLFLILQTYLFYPVSIYLLSLFKPSKKHLTEGYEPAVSVIISAYNEDKVIEGTLLKFLEIDYNQSKLEILVGSDCSSDRTNEILQNISSKHPNIHFYNFTVRRGKASVLNDLVSKASGEVLVFSDANTAYSPDAIKKLMRYYSDPEIGGVCGRLVLIDPLLIHKGNQEKRYWQIENWIKEKEGALGSLIGANGGIYSIRKEYFHPIPVDSPVMDDFFVSLKVLERKKLFIYEREAVAVEEVAGDYKVEYRRKIRNNAIDLSTLKYLKNLLSPTAGFTAYALWSHKIIRWFSPVLLILILVSNIVLYGSGNFYDILLYMQGILYFLAAIGFLLSQNGIKLFPFNLCFYFVLINYALLIGIYKFLTKQQKSHWQSTPR